MDQKRNKSYRTSEMAVISLGFFSVLFACFPSPLLLNPIQQHLDGMPKDINTNLIRFDLDWELEQLACTNQT
jgi:hypothetical protein